MTFAIFIILFLLFLIAVLNFLPVAGVLTPGFSSSLGIIVGYMKSWNFLLPINELLICVAIIVAYELIVWLWRVLKYVLHLIRGGTSG